MILKSELKDVPSQIYPQKKVINTIGLSENDEQEQINNCYQQSARKILNQEAESYGMKGSDNPSEESYSMQGAPVEDNESDQQSEDEKEEQGNTLQDDLAGLDYPMLKRIAEKAAREAEQTERGYSSVTSTYKPPNKPVMGPVSYPPTSTGGASTSKQTSVFDGSKIRARSAAMTQG